MKKNKNSRNNLIWDITTKKTYFSKLISMVELVNTKTRKKENPI